MYPEYLSGQVKLVEKTRPKRVDLALSGKPVYPPMNAEEREDVLSKYHPDYAPGAKRAVRVGPNRGQELTTEVADHPGSALHDPPEADEHASDRARL